jgi:1-acylglycerone phosphate reductase
MSSKKTVLITGCSDGGIGSGIAVSFHECGYHVFATARDVSKMSVLENLASVTLLILDVGEPTHIANALKSVESETGGTLDILINNAGRNHFMPVLDINIGEAKHIFDTNFWGPLAMMQAFAPLVIKAKGTVVNIGSISGHINVPYMGRFPFSIPRS